MGFEDQTPAGQTDAELARSAQRGDRVAFVEIVARHQALVCGTAYGILNDFAASEDAGQDAFLSAWRKIGDLENPDKLRSWLARIARNAALGKLRERRDLRPLDEVGETADGAPLPDEITAGAEEAALVREHLARLPEKYRVPLFLFYREGKSVRAVAEALDISESAVKKRLERGRSQLRDRIVGLIDSSLEQTAPKAVFTMAVATAIGALNAPSAVAATAFAASATTPAAAAASASGAVANSTGSALSFMTASQVPYVAAAIVAAACLPIGYSAHRSLERDDELGPENATVRLAIPRAEPRDAFTAWPDSELLAEWRRLHDKHGTGAESMWLIYEEIMRMPGARQVPVADPFSTEPAIANGPPYSPREDFWQKALLGALVAEWAQVDPEGGLDLMRKKMHTMAAGQLLREWVKADADAAIDWIVTFPPRRGPWISGEQLADISRVRPERLVELVARMPEPNRSDVDDDVREAFEIFAGRTGVGQALIAINGIEGGNRRIALEGILQVWGQQDAAAAKVYVEGLPSGEERDELMRNLLVGQARFSPGTALENVDEIPPGDRPGYRNLARPGTTGGRVLQAAAEADFEGTLAWMVANPNSAIWREHSALAVEVNERMVEDTHAFLDARLADGSLQMISPVIATALYYYETGKESDIADWLERQGATPALGALRGLVLRQVAGADPMRGIEMAREMGRDQVPTDQLDGVAGQIVTSRSMANFEEILAATPDFLRESVLESGFSNLTPEHLESDWDIERWAARVDQLPVDDRENAVRTITRAWVTADPEAAGQWVAEMAQDSNRWAARNTLIESWGESDPLAASMWVSALPAGRDRDYSVMELAKAIVDELPHEAWQWAMSVEAPGGSHSLDQIVRRIDGGFHRGEIDLRGWIEAADVDAAAKGRMLSLLPEEVQ